MSGGSLDYVCYKVEDVAGQIGGTPLYDAFSKHLKLVSKALHDVEWVMSSDYGSGDDEEAIRAVLGPGAELESAIESAERTLGMLKDAITAAKDTANK